VEFLATRLFDKKKIYFKYKSEIYLNVKSI
jgi:hypothetical protein